MILGSTPRQRREGISKTRAVLWGEAASGASSGSEGSNPGRELGGASPLAAWEGEGDFLFCAPRFTSRYIVHGETENKKLG
jgi:hypothetical protein